MLLELQFSQNHSGAEPFRAKANIGTNNPLTTFETSGTQCRVDDISGNELVGIFTILTSFQQAGGENLMQTFHTTSTTPIGNFISLTAAACLCWMSGVFGKTPYVCHAHVLSISYVYIVQ